VVNQIFRTGVPATVDALAILASNFKEIRCYCIRGNHGRTGKFMEETSNWDMVYYYSLESATRHIDNISWNITDDWSMIAEVMGKRFFLYHGNAIKMYLKTPIYGINTAGMGWQGAVGHFDYLSLGHFHSIGVWEQNDFDVMLNGSFVSNDDWTEEVLARKSQARQLLSFVHPKYGITGWHAIQLAK
jgi:predicted phosphodiesterase